MKVIKINFIFFCLLLLFTSCCSLRGTSVKHYYFKTFLAEQFISNQPDSVVFIDQQNVLHSFNQVVYRREIDTKNECHQCCEDNEIEKTLLFYNSKVFEPNIIFNLIADKKVDYLYMTYNWNANVSANSPYYNGTFNYISKSIQVDSIYLKLHPHIIYNDSIRLLNKVFKEVYIFEEIIPTGKIYPQKIYYNPTKGIVGIKFNNNDTWELIN